jgi:hypothetical protein
LGQPHLSRPLRYRQREIPERVEGDRTVAAVCALERRLQLPHEVVDDLRVVHAEVPGPGLRRLFAVAAETQQLPDIFVEGAS